MDSFDNEDDNPARTSNEETIEQDETSQVQADVEEQEDEQENPKLEMD